MAILKWFKSCQSRNHHLEQYSQRLLYVVTEEIELFCAVKLSNMSQYWQLSGCTGRVRQTYLDQSRNYYTLPGRSLTYSVYALSSKTQSTFCAIFVVQDTAYQSMTIDVLASATLHISAFAESSSGIMQQRQLGKARQNAFDIFLNMRKILDDAEIDSAPQAASFVGKSDTSYKCRGGCTSTVSNPVRLGSSMKGFEHHRLGGNMESCKGSSLLLWLRKEGSTY